MQSPFTSSTKCAICREKFNDTTHRPKVLQCGHSFCAPCLQTNIATGGSTCATCTALHNANSVDDIPVNICMENLIKLWLPSVAVMIVKVDIMNEAEQNLNRLEFVSDFVEGVIEENDSLFGKEAQIQHVLKEFQDCMERALTATDKKAILQGCLEFQTKIENFSSLLEDFDIKKYTYCSAKPLLQSPFTSSTECAICSGKFNDTTHRPKVLQCGHSFCAPCLQTNIAAGGSTCATCTALHNANSVDDIPVNICMENLIKLWSPLMAVMIVKEDILNEAQQNLDRLEFVSDFLKAVVIEENDSLIGKEAQIQPIQKELQDCMEKAQTATDKTAILQGCLELQTKIENLSSLLEHIENKNYTFCSAKLLLKNPKQALSILREKNRMPVYTVDDENNISRSSKLKRVGGFLEVDSMEKDVIPPSKSYILPVSSLLSAALARPVVYLELQAGGRPLGRVMIRLTCGPRRQEQIIRFCTGQEGPVWKGKCFRTAYNVGQRGESIRCVVPWTTPGLLGMEKEECNSNVRGTVVGFPTDAGFAICTRSDPSYPSMARKFGYVVSGLDLLIQVVQQCTDDEYVEQCDASHIRITEAGIEITTL